MLGKIERELLEFYVIIKYLLAWKVSFVEWFLGQV